MSNRRGHSSRHVGSRSFHRRGNRPNIRRHIVGSYSGQSPDCYYIAWPHRHLSSRGPLTVGHRVTPTVETLMLKTGQCAVVVVGGRRQQSHRRRRRVAEGRHRDRRHRIGGGRHRSGRNVGLGCRQAGRRGRAGGRLAGRRFHREVGQPWDPGTGGPLREWA